MSSELQEEYSKKVTDEEAAQAARERYLARKKARLEGTNTNTSNNPPASSWIKGCLKRSLLYRSRIKLLSSSLYSLGGI